jgi:hypothetical protein
VRALFVVTGIVVTVAVLGWGTFSTINAVSHATTVDTLTFPAARAVVVRVDAGSVVVRGSDRRDVGIERTVERGLQGPRLDERLDGDTVRLDAHCSPTTDTWCDVSYVLDVPADARVDLESTSGPLTVLSVDGDIRARTSTGDIDLADTTGAARLDTRTGAVTGARLRSGSIDASAGSGGIRLQFAAAPTRSRPTHRRHDRRGPAATPRSTT